MVKRTMLVVFDVEGVLLDAEYLPKLAELMGEAKAAEITKITNAGIRGDIVWEEGLRRRVHALRGIRYEDAKEIAEKLPLMYGAKELCSTLKKAGWKMIAVSGGFTLITDRLKDELGLDKIFSNELIFKDGVLDDVKLTVTSDKAAAVLPTIKDYGIRKEDTVVVVDGANDLKLFDIAELRVGFVPADVVRDRADEVIPSKDLTILLHLLQKKFGKAVLVNASNKR